MAVRHIDTLYNYLRGLHAFFMSYLDYYRKT